MPNSARLNFPKWSAGFTQSDVILNAIVDMLDARLSLAVRSRTENAPLGGDSAGDAYIITGSPSGAFSAFTEDYIAVYDGGTWYEFEPIAGQVAWVIDGSQGVTFTGSAWQVTSKNLPLDKLDATAAPTVDNDVDEGYSVGSHWYDVTNDAAYVCLDATDGAAVWKQIDASAGILDKFDATTDPTVNDDVDLGYSIGSRWINTTSDAVFTCADATDGAAVWVSASGLNQSQVDARVAVVGPAVAISATHTEVISATVNDDSVYSYTFDAGISCGIAIVTDNVGTRRGIFSIRTLATANCNSISSTGITATTGALTGTTGVDGAITISTHTDGKFYFENRSGGARFINIVFHTTQGIA